MGVRRRRQTRRAGTEPRPRPCCLAIADVQRAPRWTEGVVVIVERTKFMTDERELDLQLVILFQRAFQVVFAPWSPFLATDVCYLHLNQYSKVPQ